MRNSQSRSQLKQRHLQKSVSNRCVYMNQEMPKKTQKNSVQTIFHSPYKNGMPNKNYSNPTFMSSDVIYQIDYNNPSVRTPKKAIIHTQAQLRLKALYNQRMNRSSSYTNLCQRIRQNSHSIKKKAKQRQIKEKINLRNQPQKIKMSATLTNQLQNLMKFKQERELKQLSRNTNEKFFRKTPTKKQLPIYFQKVYANPNYQVQQQQKKKDQIREWLSINQELKLVRKQIQKQKAHKQTHNMIQNVQNYHQFQQQQQFKNRKNQQLLAKILKEQIKAKQKQKVFDKKQKGWRVF